MPKKKPLGVLILAAGRGSRLKSELPKALHWICGKPMLGLLMDSAQTLNPAKMAVVAGYRSDLVRNFAGKRCGIVEQKQLLGSGHAVLQAKNYFKNFDGPVLVLYCDTPLISAATMKKLLDAYYRTGSSCVLLSVEMQNPSGYGRVVRKAGLGVEKIVEHNDATDEQKNIREINVGCYVWDSKKLFDALSKIRKNDKKNEYYLTDAVEILAKNSRVESVLAKEPTELHGANSMADLAMIESIARKKVLEKLMDAGVRIHDPQTTYIDADVRIGTGTRILPNTVIEDGSVIGKNCVIGPFARIRGGSVVGDDAVIGNFVELVRSKIGKRTNVKHLSYLGDARVGSDANIGAGTITANYDGKNKHITSIGDKASVGSGTVLVAPVKVGKASVTGAGCVVPKGKNVPAGKSVVGVPARLLVKKLNK